MARPAASDLKRRRRGDRRPLPRPRGGAVSGEATAGAAAAEVAVAAQLACLLEASAPKPGNVQPGAAFHDTSYQDFLASAAAIGPAFARVGEHPLGRTIRDAIEATARWVRRNSNLGIVLLLSPLARAALERGRRSLREALAAVLAATTAADAADAYAAIRPAAPDTHSARKLGPDAAAAVTRRAQAVARAGGVRSAAGRAALAAFDAELRDARNTKNPGAAADLTTAAIFVALVEGGWSAGGGGDAGA